MGEKNPQGTQRLLNSADWDEDAIRGSLREYTGGPVEVANAALPGADDEYLAQANATRKDFISSAGRYETKSHSVNPNKINDHTE